MSIHAGASSLIKKHARTEGDTGSRSVRSRYLSYRIQLPDSSTKRHPLGRGLLKIGVAAGRLLTISSQNMRPITMISSRSWT